MCDSIAPVRHKIEYKSILDTDKTIDIQQPIECDGLPLRIVISRNTIYMGCYDIEPKVFKHIMDKYTEKFDKDPEQIEIQSGGYPC